MVYTEEDNKVFIEAIKTIRKFCESKFCRSCPINCNFYLFVGAKKN